ncbi:micrococcal nuclease [Bacillus ectoiniformans]|uniref:thermonuclease family protein n=1 Tax=Bacillus ectoiniformans TaxID=1494429 RepID=UPI00195DE245|nr:thermonuclease family protein [Bacillus ectoiniformans]MBM7650124.1 micrococcal nuclease [Bacillus ectoiniformans]
MYKKLVVAACLLVSAGCAADTTKETNSPASSEPSNIQQEKNGATDPASRLSGQVIYVVDGDTFDVKLANGKKERVRLTLVDTPETKHPSKGVQPFGPEASEFTKNALTDEQVELEFDVQERDQYGRILAYVWHQGEMINEQLIAEGLARVAIFPPNTKYVERFREVQSIAQKAKAGIWSLENYVAERGYNDEQKSESVSSAGNASHSEDCQIKGNISSSGDKIYHIPGNQSYEVTKPEEIFCTKAEAEKAGYRAAKR